jgi:uncharacterized protein YggT (Ycf19 family)
MTDNNQLAINAAERLAQYKAAKRLARAEIESEMEQHPVVVDRSSDRLAEVGEQFREEAINDVVVTDREVATARVAARGSQILDFVFYLIYGVIGLEILFDLLGARKANGIRQFVDLLSSPLLAPFHNLLPDPTTGRFQFRVSYLMALVIYVLLHLTIKALIRLVAQRRTTI